MTPIRHRIFEQPWPEGEYRLFQLGFLVEDLLGAAERWATVHGVGPFHVLPSMETSCTYRGTKSAVTLQVAVAQAGPAQIELIEQQSDGPSVYRDVFAKGESGFHQLCTITSDYDGRVAHLIGLGYELAGEIVGAEMRVAYFDTLDDFGFFTEIVEHTPGFVDHLTAISRTCADWDGSDPVRLLTRDGYRTPGSR